MSIVLSKRRFGTPGVSSPFQAAVDACCLTRVCQPVAGSIVAGEVEVYNKPHTNQPRHAALVYQDVPRDAGNSLPLGGMS
jgi:hypothetical protein